MAGIIQNLKQDAVAQICLKKKKTTSKRKKKKTRIDGASRAIASVCFLHLYFFPKEGDDEVCVAHYRLLYSTEHWFCSDFHVILVAWKQNRVTLDVMLHTIISQVT